MSEPLDPITAGVASALKSLRTRAGLREDRLAGAELPLDTLAGLERVRERVAAGETIEQAIVRAVKAAVRTLEPTNSIVADVSLCLELSKEAMPDAGLYARDLGDRRTALLENWERLHALRSAPFPGRVPAPRALRLEIETAALTALAAALTEPDRLQAAADALATAVLPGAGALPLPERAGRDGTREPPAPGEEQRLPARSAGPAIDLAGQDIGQPPPPRLVRAQAPLLLEEFQRVSRALRDSLLVGAEGTGWPHDLRKGSKPATPLATAFGLKAMLLLEGFLAPDLISVAEQLRNSASRGGGYRARVQKEPRPEVTAAVLSTLHRIDGTAKFDEQIAAMKNNFGDFERTRPFVITTVLETCVELDADPELTRSLVKDLLAARQRFGNLLLWPEKAEENLIAPVPSVAHTARAVRALVQVLTARPTARPPDGLDMEVRQAVDQAAAWLAEQHDLTNITEITDRQQRDGPPEQVYVRQFTAAWVVKALVSAGLPASDPTVSSAVARVWQQYSKSAALWTWRNGDLPVWMTLDAVEALRLAALAATIPGGLDAL